MVNGTLSRRASVSASRVLPEPVGPTSRMLDLASSTSSTSAAASRCACSGCRPRPRASSSRATGRSRTGRGRPRISAAWAGGCAPSWRPSLQFLADDVVAQFDAFVADEHAGAGDELADLVLALPAERAVEDLAAVARTALTVFAHSKHLLREPVAAENSTGGRIGSGPGCGKSLSNQPVARFSTGLDGLVRAPFQHLVDQAVGLRRVRRLEVVAVGVAGDGLDRLPGVVGQDLVQALAQVGSRGPGCRCPWPGPAKPPSGWWIITREFGSA